MSGNAMRASVDRFGNTIDVTVGYARGTLLTGSVAEYRRRSHALRRLHARIERLGRGQIFNFTGHLREYMVRADNIEAGLAEEWLGQTLVEDDLERLARAHFGASSEMTAAVFNRSSAAIVASILAFAAGASVLAIAPRCASHVSIRRGASLAGARIVEADSADIVDWAHIPDVRLVFLTRVTSELGVMSEADANQCVRKAREAGKLVFIDDAYGAQLAPVALAQPRTLAFGAELGVTSCDKAGLSGPRAGLLVGRRELVECVLAKASEIGLEGRAPLALGVLEALRHFDARQVSRDCEMAEEFSDLLTARYGVHRVKRTVMGPMVAEEDVLEIALEQHRLRSSMLVPCEASCALAMILMEDSGFLTSNVAERPGARVSLRLRPMSREVSRLGGLKRATDAIDAAFSKLRPYLADRRAAAELILGAMC